MPVKIVSSVARHGLHSPATPGDISFMVLEPGLFWQGFFNAQIGYQTSGLACIKGNPHQQPRKAGTHTPHFLADFIGNNGLQHGAVLHIDMLLEDPLKQCTSGCRHTDPFFCSNALQFCFDYGFYPKSEMDRFAFRRVGGWCLSRLGVRYMRAQTIFRGCRLGCGCAGAAHRAFILPYPFFRLGCNFCL